MITSISALATVPTDHPKLAEYFSKRYVDISHGGFSYTIDFNQVQCVFQDGNGHAKYILSPAPTWTASSNRYYVVFKNGNYLFMDLGAPTTPKPKDAWINYRTFLKDNPQFLSIP